jgi:membrane-associated phospholipid phosphatase
MELLNVRSILPFALVMAVGSPGAAAPGDAVRSQGPTGPPKAERASSGRADGRRTLRALPMNLALGTVGVFHGDNLAPLLAGATATAASSYLDDEARDAMPGEGWGESFDKTTGGLWNWVFVGSMFTAGRLAQGPRFRAMTYDLLGAAVVSAGYTGLLKVAVGRERPNGEDNRSFPSGHASNAFALATVAERHYGWKIGLPAYALAGVIGASRIEQDKHYLSDVLAGATLGFVVGRTVVRVNGRGEEGTGRGPEVRVAPILGRDVQGLSVSVVFGGGRRS